MSAFDVLMTSSKRKADELDADNVIGIGYEAKLCGEGVDPNDPLYGTCYYGIAVRGGFTSPEALYAKRKREHESAARCDPKEIGFRAIIVRYGNRALSWRIVVSKSKIIFFNIKNFEYRIRLWYFNFLRDKIGFCRLR